MMHFACFASISNNWHQTAFAFSNKVIIQAGNRQKNRNDQIITRCTAIRDNQNVASGINSAFGITEQIFKSLLQSVRAFDIAVA